MSGAKAGARPRRGGRRPRRPPVPAARSGDRARTEAGALLRDLTSPFASDRRRAAHQLARFPRSAVRIALERSLGDPDAGVRLAASSSLGSIGDPRARPALEGLLADVHWNVRAQAAYALSRTPHPSSVPLLVDHLAHDESALVRNACALTLTHIGDPRAAPALERALTDESDRVRREAVLGLERSGGPEVPARIRPLLADPARRVRIAAAMVLGARRDREATPLLLDRLRRADPWERPALLVALGRIGAPESVEALARAAEDPMHSVRVCAIHALGEMRSPRALEVAAAKLSDRSWAVRGAAALAIGKAGRRSDAPVVVPLLRDPHPWPRRGAIYALGELRAEAARAELRRALDDEDPEVRLAAIWALGRLADLEARPRLEEELRHLEAAPSVPGSTVARGEGAVRLVSDAESRLFDTLVEALGALQARTPEISTARLLVRAARRLTDEEWSRPARLPAPVGGGTPGGSRRELFARIGIVRPRPTPEDKSGRVYKGFRTVSPRTPGDA